MNQRMSNQLLFFGTCALETLYGVISMFAAVLLNNLATSVGSLTSVGGLLRVGLPVIFFAAVYGGLRAAADSATQVYAERAAQADRNAIAQAILSMNNAVFARRDTGEYLNLLSSDVLLVREQYYAKVPLLPCYAAQFIFCVVYSLILNPVVGLVLMALSAMQYCVPLLFSKGIDRRMVEQSRQTGRFTSKAKELLLGFSVVKSYGAQALAQEELRRTDEDMTRARTKTAVLTYVMMCSNLIMGWAMVVIPVVLSGYFVIKGNMEVGTLLTVFYLANRYSMPAMDFSAAWSNIKSTRGIREKLDDFLRENPVKPEAESRSIRRSVEVQGLSFSYDGKTPALKDVSFVFEAGKKYLLLGESGCGKSTLLKLLAGLYPSAGIRVDGVPLEDIPAGGLRGNLILVGQQPYLFRRTVADNIDFLGVGDRARLMDAAEKCRLTEFLSTLPQGIDTLVDEEQRQLSGGQKARIGLARAIYTRPAVLLLDEVTSALDSQSAREIEEMILGLEGTMVIHVAHKPTPELMERYDAVLTMPLAVCPNQD